MKKNRVLTRALTLFCVLCLFSTACFAGADDYLWITKKDTWKIASVMSGGHTNSGDPWHLQVNGVNNPAARDGEVVTMSCTKEYSTSVSGSICVPTSTLQAAIGFSITYSDTFSVSLNSAPLKKGEYVKGYWRKAYETKVVRQECYRTGSAYPKGPDGESAGELTHFTNMLIDTKFVRVNKPIMPDLKFTYHSSSNTNSVGGTVRAEEYTWGPDGRYHLAKVYQEPVNGSTF